MEITIIVAIHNKNGKGLLLERWKKALTVAGRRNPQ